MTSQTSESTLLQDQVQACLEAFTVLSSILSQAEPPKLFEKRLPGRPKKEQPPPAQGQVKHLLSDDEPELSFNFSKLEQERFKLEFIHEVDDLGRPIQEVLAELAPLYGVTYSQAYHVALGTHK